MGILNAFIISKYILYRISQCEDWKAAIAPHIQGVQRSEGMICINHFCDVDLIPATETKPIALKKGAVPTNFKTSNDDETNDNIEFLNTNNANSANSESMSSIRCEDSANLDGLDEGNAINRRNNDTDENDKNQCSNKACELLRIQYKNICGDSFTENANNNIKVQKLEKQIERLRATIQSQTDQIKRLDKKISRTLEAKSLLENILKDLQEQNILQKDVMEILKVSKIYNTFNFIIL